MRPHVQIQCSIPGCGHVCVIPKEEYEKAIKVDVICCVVPYCPGNMRKFGRELTNRRTIALKQNYASALARKLEPRKRKLNRMFAGDDWEAGEDDPDGAEPPLKKVHYEEYDAEDAEWLMPAEFNPAMRLTADGHEAPRACDPALAVWIHNKCPGPLAITNPIAGERQKATGTAMGGRSAWRYARDSGALNAKPFKPGARNYYEWCHLHGDRLGGKCEAGNLVAAHYAVNTWMLAIESVLIGKAGYMTEVTAFCSTQDIAEFIHYRVLNRANNKVAYETFIDGHVTKFSQADFDRVKLEVQTRLA